MTLHLIYWRPYLRLPSRASIACHVGLILLSLGLSGSLRSQTTQYGYDNNGSLIVRATENLAPPQIVRQPQLQIVAPGELASFSVVMADTRSLTYQWRFNGTSISGATGDTLLLRSVSAASEGPYSVVVTNISGSVTSNPAMLWWDGNGNGLPDSWELAYFGNLSQRAEGDADGDGISNLQEFLDGTNPTNSASGLWRLTVFSDGGAVAVAPTKLGYDPGEAVTLTATPFAPNTFHAWSGDLITRSNPASLNMDSNKTVRARFISAPAPPGMVAWWRGETDATDIIGGHNGTFYSGSSTIGPTITNAGFVDNAFSLDGTVHIRVPDASDLRPAQFTIEGWVYPSAQSGYQAILARGSVINGENAYWFGVFNGLPQFYTKNAGQGMNSVQAPSNLPLNQWSHLAGTFDGSTKRLYVNGVLVAAAGGLGPLQYEPAPIPITLGAKWEVNAPVHFWNGRLDEVSFYNRALSDTEVVNLYTADAAGKSTIAPYIVSSGLFPDAAAGVSYTQQVTTVLGALPISFSLSAGSLPAGLALSTVGLLSGIPTSAGSNVFAILATDAAGVSTELVCTLYVAPVLVSVVPGGLLAWWRAESNALDFVGTHHGSLSNGATYAVGKVGQAFSFDGVDAYFVAPDVGLPSGNAPRTVELWMRYQPGASGNHQPFFYGGRAASDSFYMAIIGSRLYIGNYGGGDTPGSTIATDGNWHHLALTHDGSTTRMYVDGQLDTLVNRTYATVLSGSFYMGAVLGIADRFKGQVDELAVYDRALSQFELAAIYNAGAAGKKTSGPYINTAAFLPDAFVGQSYSQTFNSIFAAPPVTYLVATGTLPAGLTLGSAGVLSGTPTGSGAFNFTVRATDAASVTGEQAFTLQVFSKVPPPGGLVGWWRAENDALDAAGTNNGVLRNGAAFATGKVGQAFALDGGSQSIDIADAPALRPTSLTIEAWIFFNGGDNSRVFFAKPLGAANLNSYVFVLYNGTLNAAVSDTNGFGPTLNSAFPSAPAQWHHVAYTFDDATKQQAMYFDGAQVAAGVANKSISYDNQPLLLGRDIANGSPNYFFSGRIDEAALYNRALGAAEIASIYHAGPAGKTATGPYFITPPLLPSAVASQAYTQTLATIRGTPSLTFAVTGGTLPNGLTLDSGGLLSGTPIGPGNFSFTVRATDAATLTADQTFTLQVLPHVSPPAGIVAWWRAENDALDSVGANDGVLVNGATFAPGKVGQAFSLDGVDAAIEIMDAPALRPASVTMESWVMFFSGGGPQYIITKTVGDGGADSYALWFDNGNLRGMVCDITGANSFISVPFPPTIGRWYHVAFTFDDTSKQQWLYLDGIAVAYGTSNREIGYDAHSVLLGADVQNGVQGFVLQGRIDEAAIYNRALSAAEVTTLYSAGAAGKTAIGPYVNTPPLLPGAGVGQAYTQTITSIRGTVPVAYSVAGGALPAGLTFNASGTLGGTPTTAGTFNFVARVTDAAGLLAEQSFTLQVSAPVPPPAGLVSWWRAEHNALDELGVNNGIALNGATFAPGKVGEGFLLDGINDCIQIADSPSLRSASITVEAWVNFNVATGVRLIFARPLGSGILDSFAVWWQNGNLSAIMSDNSGNGPMLSYPFTPALGQWYHVAYTFDDASRQQVLYLDNVTVASGAANRPIAYDSHPLMLGCDIDNGGRDWFFAGRIDEAAFFNRALTAPEIAAIHQSGAAGKTTVGPYFTTPPPLPDAIINQGYAQAITAVRGTGTVVYTVVGGILPPGLALSSNGGLSGVPVAPGSFQFLVRATDSAGLIAEQFYLVQVFAPVPAPSKLLAWWRAENNARDSVGTNHGVLVNTTFAAGKVGSAFELNGTNSVVQVPNSAWLNPTGAFSVEAWIKASPQQFSADGYFLVVDKSHGCNDGTGWVLLGAPDGTMEFAFGKGGSPTPANFPYVTSLASVRDGLWHHVAAVFTGTQLLIYQDGFLANAASVADLPAPNSRDVEIGRWCGFYDRSFHGLIDEVSYYDRALAPGEVSGIFNAGPAGKQLAVTPPSLSVLQTPTNTVVVSWASLSASFILQQSTNLATSNWSPASETLNDNGTNTFIIVNPPLGTTFYRLSKP